MKKQKNSITEQDILKQLDKLNSLLHKKTLKPCPAYRVMERIYWLQNSIISEAFNFKAFTDVLVPAKIVDLSPVFKGVPPKMARYCIHHGTKNQRVLHADDVTNLINQIKSNVIKYNKDKFAKYMY